MRFTTLCYIEKENQYLMLHRTAKEKDANKDKWIGLGGKFEEGESPEDCLLREIKEEAGVTLTKYQFRGIVTFASDQWEDEYMCLYTATEYEGELTACNEGELAWVDKDKIVSLNLWEGDRIFLDLLKERECFFSLKLRYQGEALVEAVLDGKALEFFDLRDENGMPTGKVKPRSLVHQDGDCHGTAHIWVVRRQKDSFEVLLQKRSKTKDTYPGCYDISSAGHLDPGEEYLAGARRELREELGIEANEEDLHFIGMHDAKMEGNFYGKPFRNHEISSVYVYERPLAIETLALQKEEVEEVIWMEYEECVKKVREGSIKNCLILEELAMVAKYMNGEHD